MIDERTLHRLGGIASVLQLRATGATSDELTAAARTYGLWAGSDPRLHLQFSGHARAGPVESPHVRHWLPTEHSAEVWRVTLADCLRSVARCADEETAVAVFDTALTAGLVNLRQLRAVLSGQPVNVRRRWMLARPGSDSGVESIVRQRLQARGHLVEQQVHVDGVGRVDMRLAARGSPRLRVSAAQVTEDWTAVLDLLDRVLARSAHSANSQDRRDQLGALPCFIH